MNQHYQVVSESLFMIQVDENPYRRQSIDHLRSVVANMHGISEKDFSRQDKITNLVDRMSKIRMVERMIERCKQKKFRPEFSGELIFQILKSKGILNGLSDKLGTKEGDVDPNELQSGIEVEKEHTDAPLLAKKIALDHLSEKPDYYSKLKKMENED